jgi:electron transfer flavoprotein alpha subunit
MATVQVYVEHRNGAVAGVTFELLAAARDLADAGGMSVEAVVAAAQPDPLLADLGAADRVRVIRHPALSPYLPEAHAAALKAAVEAGEPDLLLMAYSSIGLDLAPNVAVACARSLVSYAVRLELADGALLATSVIYGGKLRGEIRLELPAAVTLTPGSYREDDGRRPGSPERVDQAPPDELDHLRTHVVSENTPDPEAVDITAAPRIVCVGRGLGDAEAIGDVEALCRAMGAELAGSRPVIDSGWLPKERQIGKSGHKVKARMYLSLGVSGAPEHLEGMGECDLIIAVNSDPNAPIFEHAHYGAACDLFDVLPALAERFR